MNGYVPVDEGFLHLLLSLVTGKRAILCLQQKLGMEARRSGVQGHHPQLCSAKEPILEHTRCCLRIKQQDSTWWPGNIVQWDAVCPTCMRPQSNPSTGKKNKQKKAKCSFTFTYSSMKRVSMPRHLCGSQGTAYTMWVLGFKLSPGSTQLYLPSHH